MCVRVRALISVFSERYAFTHRNRDRVQGTYNKHSVLSAIQPSHTHTHTHLCYAICILFVSTLVVPSCCLFGSAVCASFCLWRIAVISHFSTDIFRYSLLYVWSSSSSTLLPFIFILRQFASRELIICVAYICFVWKKLKSIYHFTNGFSIECVMNVLACIDMYRRH